MDKLSRKKYKANEKLPDNTQSAWHTVKSKKGWGGDSGREGHERGDTYIYTYS